MSILRVVSRYARSLFELSKSDGKLDSVHDDVMNAWDVVKHEEFNSFLKSPVISISKKKEVIAAIFAEYDAGLLQTFNVMANHKREAFIGDFCRSFHLMYNKENHVSVVRLVSAVELSDNTINELLSTFKSKGLLEEKVELVKEIKPSIIGGFILEFDGQVYNASLGHKLEQMSKKFSENLYIKNI
ncbi:MAG: ATP synthase F1 subunit delta [Saprospiraceae bacterium]|nr:ATP synthase F1 subunit delta [Saprospiraceae bacterium]